MAIPDVLLGPLGPLAAQAGGMAVLKYLPFETLAMAVTHTDDVLAVGYLIPALELYNADVSQGYALFDRHYQTLYEETPDTGLTEGIWGTTLHDRTWLAGAQLGEWAYLEYTQLDGVKRVIMLIRI